MDIQALQSELDNLKAKIVELSGRIRMTRDFSEKEKLKAEVDKIQKQIEVLEKYVIKDGQQNILPRQEQNQSSY